MTRLFSERDWEIRVGTVLITPGTPGRTLTCEFEVTKTTAREPNKCTVKIANLTRRRRDELAELDEPELQVIAGYRDFKDTIFAGDVRDLWSYREGVDTWTEIEAEDSGRSYRTARIEQSFAPGTSLSTVIRACAVAMGVGVGNTDEIAADAELPSGSNTYPTGTTVSGVAWRQLNRIATSASLRWSVQNGVLQFRRPGQAAETVSAPHLSPGTGLLESPTRGARDQRTGRITYGAKCLMNPAVYPGRVVRISSRELSADLMVKRATYSGSTTGENWFVDTELQEYERR